MYATCGTSMHKPQWIVINDILIFPYENDAWHFYFLFQKSALLFQVLCNKEDIFGKNPLCSGEEKLITITDECLHGRCDESTYHIDMSGIAFGSLADPGKEFQLQKAGKIRVMIMR